MPLLQRHQSNHKSLDLRGAAQDTSPRAACLGPCLGLKGLCAEQSAAYCMFSREGGFLASRAVRGPLREPLQEVEEGVELEVELEEWFEREREKKGVVVAE